MHAFPNARGLYRGGKWGGGGGKGGHGTVGID